MSAVLLLVTVAVVMMVVARPGHASLVHGVPCKKHYTTSNGLCFSSAIPHSEVVATVVTTHWELHDASTSILDPMATIQAPMATAYA